MISQRTHRIGGITISWITIFVQVLVSLFFVPFFLKSVGNKQYGLYSFSTSLIAWLDALMIAVSTAYYKFLTREKSISGKKGEAAACGVFFKIFIVISILVLVGGLLFDLLLFLNIVPLSEYTTIEKNQICVIILMSLISTTFSTLLTTSKSYPYYKGKYIITYSASLLQILVQVSVSFFLLKIGLGVVYVAAAHFGSAVLITAILSLISKYGFKQEIIVKPENKSDKKNRKKLAKEIIVFSSFVIINTVVDLLNKSLDKTLLGFYNAYSVANYQLAYSLPSYLMSFTSAITVVFAQKINETYYGPNGLEGTKNLFLRVSKIQTFVTFLLVGGFVVCGKEFITLWLDNTRMQVYYVACSLMITYSLTCSNGVATVVRRLQNKHIKASLIYLFIAVSNVGASILFINLLGKENAIWGCVLGTVVTYLIGHYVIMQIYDSKFVGLDITKFFISFVMFGVVAFVSGVAAGRAVELFAFKNAIVCLLLKAIFFTLLFSTLLFFVDSDIKKAAKILANKLFAKKGKQNQQ